MHGAVGHGTLHASILGAHGPSVISGIGPGSSGNVWSSYWSAHGSNAHLGSTASNLIGTVLSDNITREGVDSWFGCCTHGTAALGSRGAVVGTGKGVPIMGTGRGSLHAGGNVGAIGVGFEDDDLGARLVECGGNCNNLCYGHPN
jgi:hypothetical protein